MGVAPGRAHYTPERRIGPIERMHEMDVTCKWATIGIFMTVFIDLVWIAGCIHILEFLGSITVGFFVARSFYFGACREYADHVVHQK